MEKREPWKKAPRTSPKADADTVNNKSAKSTGMAKAPPGHNQRCMSSVVPTRDGPGESDAQYHDTSPHTAPFGLQQDAPEPEPSSPADSPTRDSSSEDNCSGSHYARMKIPPCMHRDAADVLQNAISAPPVNKDSLEELDLMWIQNNISLRVDINYDHDLHFMPVSGRKGEQKRHEAQRYWLSLTEEFRIIYRHDLVGDCAKCQELQSGQTKRKPAYFKPRIPQMFHDLRDLLMILVPDSDQEEVMQHLEITLLLQQVSHGVLDVVSLANWLCALLTTHCAPIRDNSAQEMAAQIRSGVESGDLEALVGGIAQLFGFLESMKLDVANHQIRSFRYQLIDDTVAFQREYFTARVKNGKIQLEDSLQWFRASAEDYKRSDRRVDKPLILPVETLTHGLTKLCLAETPNGTYPPIPDTLAHDKSRIQTIRDEIQDIAHLRICLKIFNSRIRSLIGDNCNPAAMHVALQTRIMALTEGELGANATVADVWESYAGAIAVAITRAAYSVCRRTNVKISTTEVDCVTDAITRSFRHERTRGMQAKAIADEVERGALQIAVVFSTMGTLAISEEQKRWHRLRQAQQPSRNMPDVQTMARKIAHVAAVHSMVWTEMVYLADVEIAENSTHSLDVEDDALFSDASANDGTEKR